MEPTKIKIDPDCLNCLRPSTPVPVEALLVGPMLAPLVARGSQFKPKPSPLGREERLRREAEALRAHGEQVGGSIQRECAEEANDLEALRDEELSERAMHVASALFTRRSFSL